MIICVERNYTEVLNEYRVEDQMVRSVKHEREGGSDGTNTLRYRRD